MNEQPIRVALLLFDGVQVLDAAGPLEVLTTSRTKPEIQAPRAFDVFLVAENLKPVNASNAGPVFMPAYTLETVPDFQILIVPGGDTDQAEVNGRLLDWIKQKSSKTELTGSVCTGAFLLAKAGLLKNRPATTHWYFLDRLRNEFPDIDVQRDVRFVEKDRIITAAGISAGIDMALRIVERYYSKEAAMFTAKIMQYDSPHYQ